MQYLGVGRLSTVQSTAYSTTAGSVATSFGTQTFKVRIVSTTAAYIAFGKAPVAASTSGSYIPADSPEYFIVSPGEKVSGVQVSGAGTLYVTELS